MMAPNLYNQTHYKYRTVCKELHNMSWIRNLKQINSETLFDEFILLFTALSDIVLNEEKDVIWKAKTNPKCRFFTWLAMLKKVPTADNLMMKAYPCNPNCALCYIIP
jgi:hypothetical protein